SIRGLARMYICREAYLFFDRPRAWGGQMASDWNAAVADVIGALGTPRFPAALVAALRGIVDFDYTVMFAYRGDARPIDLYDDFPTGKRNVMVDAYQDGPYL